jgi:hypothetical protein
MVGPDGDTPLPKILCISDAVYVQQQSVANPRYSRKLLASMRFVSDAEPGIYDEKTFFQNVSRMFGIISQDFDELVSEGLFGKNEVPIPLDKTSVDVGDHWRQPQVAKCVAVPVVAAMSDDKPQFTRHPDIISVFRDGVEHVQMRDPGTGPGVAYFTPPEIRLKHLYGHKGESGTTDDAALPADVTDNAIGCWSGEDGTATTKGTQFNCGFMAVGTINPASGWYLKRTGPGDMKIQTTAADGSDDNAGTITINGTTWQSILDRLDALEAL